MTTCRGVVSGTSVKRKVFGVRPVVSSATTVRVYDLGSRTAQSSRHCIEPATFTRPFSLSGKQSTISLVDCVWVRSNSVHDTFGTCPFRYTYYIWHPRFCLHCHAFYEQSLATVTASTADETPLIPDLSIILYGSEAWTLVSDGTKTVRARPRPRPRIRQ